MNILLLILSLLLLLIVLLLFCPLAVKISYRDKVRLKVGYLFPLISVPLEKKTETDPKKAAKKEARRRKKEEKKRLKNEKKKKKAGQPTEEKKGSPFLAKIKAKGLDGLIELLKEFVRIIGYFLDKVSRHLVISRMDVQIAVATEDAARTALTCGYVYTTIFPLLSFIEQHVKRCCHRERIFPVFTQTETTVDFVLQARIMPFFILSGLLGSLIKGWKALAKS